MIQKKCIHVLVVLIYFGFVSSALDACMTTLINDGNSKIAVYNENDKAFMIIPKNKKRRFGSPREHAHFSIYVQQPKTRVFARIYECRQNTCGSNGNIILKLSDIKNNSQVTDLFTITKEVSRHSMVEDLPMVRKKDCTACQYEIN